MNFVLYLGYRLRSSVPSIPRLEQEAEKLVQQQSTTLDRDFVNMFISNHIMCKMFSLFLRSSEPNHIT